MASLTAVDDFRVHVFIGETGGAADKRIDARHFAVGSARHAEVVVDEAVDNRKTEVDAGESRIGELSLACPVERFQHNAVGISSVAGECADDFSFVRRIDVDAVGHCRARGDRDAAADDRVCSEVSDAEVRDVHSAAASFAVAGFFTEEFGNGSENMVLEDGFQKCVAGEGGEFGAARLELCLGHSLDGVEALRNGVTVSAVGGGDFVRDVESGADARRCCFLTDGKVCRTAVFIVAEDFIGAVFEFEDHFLELADDEHGLIEFRQIFLFDMSGFEFLLHVFVILILGDGVQFYFSGLEIRTGIAQVVAHFVLLEFVRI